MPLSYTRFAADVGAGAVRTVTIDPAGRVAGSLAGGQPFTTTIAVALDDRTLAGQLAAHHVQVTATTATGSSLLSALIGLLPLLLIGGLLFTGVATPAGRASAASAASAGWAAQAGWAGQAAWPRPGHGSSKPSARPPGSPTWPAIPR
jgi:hypothetical protein